VAEAGPRDRGQELYERNCAACHGDKGGGDGAAARFLYPKPRNFGEAKFRVVSTKNRVPSDEDLLQVISHGMPGSAMFAFGHLPEEDRRALVGQVRRLTSEALLEKEKRQARERGEEVDEKELAATLADFLTPGERLPVPADLPAPSPESVARGRALYQEKGCVPCHGPKGVGDGAQDQRDDSGVPIRPRDFGRGLFKGGYSPGQLYARLVLGMPGSPMPASLNLSAADAGHLINFMLSLSTPEVRARAEHRRGALTARVVAADLARDFPERLWDGAPAVPVAVSPLWWRTQAEPDLQVAAVHDGRTLAVRLSWRDEAPNERAGPSDEFEDMAAVQLFKGEREPFLGMGAEGAAVDLWQWRPSWGKPPAAAADGPLDDYPFDSPQYRAVVKGGGVPDFLTARAAGNLLARPDPSATAGNLAAKGPGSTTFLPKASQAVSAAAAWKDGRWAVVLRRPLAVAAGEGVPLAAGDRCSVAFALWFGEARDRNGQKLVSVWHDLTIE
jgi:cytochrome c